MKSKLLLKYLCLTSLSLFIMGCDKYLDQQPKFLLTESNGIINLNKAKAAVRGIYSTLAGDNWSGELYVGQATKAGFIRFTGSLDYNFAYRQGNRTASMLIWETFYKSLNAANFAIEGINNLEDNIFPTIEDKHQLLAEAKVMRAWVNLNILWNFGYWWADDDSPYGLIYKDKPSSLANAHAARINVGESYAKIFEDLDYAISNGSTFSSPRYASKQFAQALKAKALLYRDGYRNNVAGLHEALDLVNKVIGSPVGYELESDLNEMYKQSWDSKENIFVRYLENDGSRTSIGETWYTYGIIYEGNALPLDENEELTAGLRYGLDWFKADYRWTIATGEVRVPYDSDDTFRYTFKKLVRSGSYEGELGGVVDDKFATYYLRLAELYIIKAELLARTGASISEAIAPINELRAKRTAQNFSQLKPNSKDELYELIFKEIFLELFLENGSEFFASLRFSKDGVPWNTVIKDGLALDITKVSWPIPDSEMINNTLAVQNPNQN